VVPEDPSWTSALVARVLSWPFDAGIRPESQWGRSMGRLRQGVPVIVLLLALECTGCGGGAASFSQPPPPSAADFSLGFSTGVHLAGRHEPGDQYNGERFEWLYRYRSDHA
jgi:hypothetical protein